MSWRKQVKGRSQLLGLDETFSPPEVFRPGKRAHAYGRKTSWKMMGGPSAIWHVFIGPDREWGE